MRAPWPAALAPALGALAVFGFAPFELFPLPLLSLAGLFLLCRGTAGWRAAAWLGFLWGLGFFLAGVSWVYVSMHDVGGMPAAVAGLATLAFCAYLALFPALACALPKRLGAGAGWRAACAAAASWMLAEWLRGWLFTGFPWLSIGYSQSPPSPLAGYAPVLGVRGVELALALTAALPVFAVKGRQRVFAWLTAALLIAGGACLRVPQWTHPQGPPLTVSLLQGNIPQSLKWEPGRLQQSLDAYARLTAAHPAQLTVLPETAIPLFLDEVPRGYLRLLSAHGAVLVGVAMQRESGGYVNAAAGIPAGSDEPLPKAYAKRHLVPFGEFIPPGFAWFLDLMHIPMSDFSRGPDRQPPLELAAQRVAPDICYEDLFGTEIIRALPDATLLVNMSNTAWFGHSLAQPQHLQISRMRAIETGRPMLRSTNTGMTAAVLPDGSVKAVLPPFTEGAVVTEVQGYAGVTPYVRWGDLPALLLALLPALAALKKPRASRGN